MEKPFLAVFCTGFVLSDVIRGFPAEYSSVSTEGQSPEWLTGYFITVFGFLLTIVTIIYGCICCRNGKGFKEFSNSSGSLANTRGEGFVNPAANAELTIFPPAGATASEICRFEPLPDFKPQTPNLRPAAFSYKEREISSQDWFSEPFDNFPRNQLKYVEEYGRGWFGRVVEGEAQNIIPKEKLTKVMVKILHEDATPTDQMYFLHEVKFYKDLKHPNILQLLGRCLETEPFLIILECYPNGDLKTFLSQNMASARALVEQGATLQMCSNITAGLDYMHKNRFIHTDLAARNCLVRPDLTVKIGDYGNSIENFKSDYYCAGSVALPIRWCAPETLKCTDVTIETREVTPPANMWSLGVVFWEICEFCKLPYSELNDDQVIVRVLGDKNYFLEKPIMFCLYKEEMYNLMKLCWSHSLQRPTASQVQKILDNLISSDNPKSKDLARHPQDFERRWQNLKPNYIPKKDDPDDEKDRNASCMSISSILKNAKIVDSSYVESPLGVFVSSNRNLGQDSPRFCLKSDKEMLSEENKENNKIVNGNNDGGFKKNDINIDIDARDVKTKTEFELNSEMRLPEALNSKDKFKHVEADVDSWLKGVEINSEEDECFVRKVSEAIRDLDAALALEKTSSSEEESGNSSHQNSPGKKWAEENVKIVVDFKLGSDVPSFLNYTQKSFELSSLQNSKQPQSLNFKDPYLNKKENELIATPEKSDFFTENNFDLKNYEFYESFKENDSIVGTQSRHSSDTDDEVWRKRIEKGEISEKVKEKSKSIANLMILTHIDTSDDSDYDYDSKFFEKTPNRSSFSRRNSSFAKASCSSNVFGSENDLSNAVLEDDFKNSLKKLSNDHKEYGRFDSLGMILPTLAGRENVWENLLKNSSNVESEVPVQNQAELSKNEEDEMTIEKSGVQSETKEDSDAVELSDGTELENSNDSNNFLGKIASEKLNSKNESISICQTGPEPDKDENNDGGSIDMEKSATSDYFSEKEDNLLHLKYDNTLSTDSSNSSKRNSSQLNEDIFEEGTNEKENPETNFVLEKEAPNNEKYESSSALHETTACHLDNFNFKMERSTDPNSQEKKEGDTSCECFDETCDRFHNILKKIPEITISKAKEYVEMPKNTFEHLNFPAKPIENFQKIDNSELKIFVTEDWENVSSEDTEEQIQLNFDKRPFRFVFKEDETKELKEIEEKFEKQSDDLDDSMKPENDSDEKNKKTFGGNIEYDTRTVIMGPCEEFTLDYFKGLKTTSDELLKYVEIDDKTDWQQHLEKALIQQMNEKDFDDISFENVCVNSWSSQEPVLKSISDEDEKNLNSAEVLNNFLNSEKVHTEKVAGDLYDLNRLTDNEEEYDNFKFRTPDDERSSDSGFRDKGSLSESVEDACEGKYNLEDIEAELEEAYVKGAFENCDAEKEPEERESYFSELNDGKNCNNFEYEEVKFYEGDNKNEDDLSDMDGEMEFWQNKDGSDYYPKISEFNPTCSQGWYLHPPEELAASCSRNVNEDLVNALRNELKENLPVQTRSFKEFSDDDDDEEEDFFKSPFDDFRQELNFHYATDFSMPLSPIVEEYDPTAQETIKKSENSSFERNGHNRVMKKSLMNLMETVKSIDTNTFMQYLDYMVENEGGDLDDLDEIDVNDVEVKGQIKCDSENIDDCSQNVIAEKRPQMLEKDKAKSENLFQEVERLKENNLETESEDNVAVDDSLFFPEAISPDRERSLSDISRSSNETQTGDALSEITLSSPDLVPDYFLNIDQNNEGSEAEKKTAGSTEYGSLDLVPPDPKTVSEIFLLNERKHLTNSLAEEPTEATKPSVCGVEEGESNFYEMSTSFMGEDDAEDNSEEDNDGNDSAGPDSIEKREVDDIAAAHWDSDSSATEEMSSSSGEFIWKIFTDTNIDGVTAKDSGCFPAVKKTDDNNKLNQSEKKSESNNDEDDKDDEDDEDDKSSTGSSASITDFVPSAWNSQAMPERSALRIHSESLPTVQKKKSVWFKKQKYHCIYEYPRELSDSEDTDSFNQLSSLDSPGLKHFTFGVNTVGLPNKHFPYGISNVIDYSTCSEWDVLEGSEKDCRMIDADSDLGPGKSNSAKETDFNFHNLSPFDYDFNSTSNISNGHEFFVSSSSRPFQMASNFSVFEGSNETSLEKLKSFEKNDSGESDEASDSRDFTTPDSGLEDSTNVSPLGKKSDTEELETSILLQIDDLDTARDSKSVSAQETIEKDDEKLRNGSKANATDSENFPEATPQASLVLPLGLGKLRHTRNTLKLDLPFNHNVEMGAMRSKKINQIH